MENNIDMDMIIEGSKAYWGQFLSWFLEIPLLGQILLIAGTIAILVLVCVGVYYILKGTAYLVYYILKGTAYLVYYIFKGMYMLFEGLYYLISGKEKPVKQVEVPKEVPEVEATVQEIPKQVIPMKTEVHGSVSFCSQCGNKYSDSVKHQLTTQGQAFCVHCGEGLTANPIEI